MVEILARVKYCKTHWWQAWGTPDGLIHYAVQKFYVSTLPEYHHYPVKKEFYSEMSDEQIFVWLTSEDADAEKHLQIIEKESSPMQIYIHVPQWFSDFKAACKMVLDEIESGNIEDINKMTLRIKEFNPVYDSYFQKEDGWIYITNHLPFSKLFVLIMYVGWLSAKTGFKYKIDVFK